MIENGPQEERAILPVSRFRKRLLKERIPFGNFISSFSFELND
jgi:hypothetical protein